MDTHTQDIHAAIDLTCWGAFFDDEAHEGWHFGKQQHDCEEALQRIVIDAECRRDKAGTMLTQCLQRSSVQFLLCIIAGICIHELVAQIIVPQNADPIFHLTLIDQNTAAENIEVFREPSPECGMCAESNKTTGIINATNVMIISLNRGHGHLICDGHRTERYYESKCLTLIIPDPVLHLGSKTFGLRSEVTHIGSQTHHGHYITYITLSDNRGFRVYDDSKSWCVGGLSEDVHKNSRLLVYERIFLSEQPIAMKTSTLSDQTDEADSSPESIDTDDSDEPGSDHDYAGECDAAEDLRKDATELLHRFETNENPDQYLAQLPAVHPSIHRLGPQAILSRMREHAQILTKSQLSGQAAVA